MDSFEFKKMAFGKVRGITDRNGDHPAVVMENEPENLNALVQAFPEATPIFVEGAWIKSQPLLGAPIRVRHFR